MPEPSFPVVLTIFGCLLILGFFSWSLGTLWWQLRRDVLLPLRALRRRLPAPHELAAQWERYSLELEAPNNRALHSMWRDYRSTVVQSGDRLRSLRPASACLVPEALALKLNTQLFSLMPNLLTGMGLFFTFCGLVIGISGAKGSVTAAEQLGRTAALETLLGGAHLAFWTSALGLGLSLVMTYFSKRRWHSVEQACADWAADLDALVVPLCAAEVAFLHLETARQSAAQLERFNTDLALSIARALDEQQARWLQPTLEKLIDAANAMRENQVNFDERLTGELLSKFEATLTGSAQSKISEMASAMGTAAQQLSTSSSTIAEQQARWTEEMRTVASSLREQVEAATAATQQRVGQLLQAVDQTLAGVHARLQAGVSGAVTSIQESGASVSHQLREAASELRTVVGEVQAATERVTEAAKAFAASKSAFAKLAPQLRAAGEDVRAAANEIVSTMQSAAQLQQDLLATAQVIKDEHASLAKLLEAFEKRFAQVDESAQGLFKEINEGLNAFATQVREFLGEVDEHLAQATSTLGQSIEDLSDVIDEMPKPQPTER